MNDFQNIFNMLASDEYYLVKKNINSIIDNREFIDAIITVKNPLVFDRFIKMVEYKIDTSEIHEKRNIFIKKAINSLNDDNFYSFFELDNVKEECKKIVAERYLTEYIVNYYFHDNYYNFMTNLYQMIMYLELIDSKLIDQDHIKLYKDFVNLKDLSLQDKIMFFKSHLQDNNLMELFYDDINKLRIDSHKGLTKKTIKLNKESPLYQKDLSRRFELDIYYLDGEEFYGFVRVLSIKSSFYDINDYNYIFGKQDRLGYNFSYISHNNIGTTDYTNKNIALFYADIDYRDIMYVHHSDLHTGILKKQDSYISEKENELLTPEQLISKTQNYNDIYVKKGDNGIKPTALICYDRISYNDEAFAKKFGLPILLINTKRYKRYETYDEKYDENSYTI